MSATVDPQPVISSVTTPPISTMRERKTPVSADDDESEEEQPVRARNRKAAMKQQEQQILAGVPNELLLPGAIVTLAVVIIGVFAITRSNSR
jgi:hypothetical protein